MLRSSSRRNVHRARVRGQGKHQRHCIPLSQDQLIPLSSSRNSAHRRDGLSTW